MEWGQAAAMGVTMQIGSISILPASSMFEFLSIRATLRQSLCDGELSEFMAQRENGTDAR